jgi:hypothetical protein
MTKRNAYDKWNISVVICDTDIQMSNNFEIAIYRTIDSIGILVLFTDLSREMIVHFVDIGGIIYNHCLSSLN